MSRRDETPVDQSWMGEDMIAEMEGYMAFTNPVHPESYREGFRTALAVIEWPKVKSEHLRVVGEKDARIAELLKEVGFPWGQGDFVTAKEYADLHSRETVKLEAKLAAAEKVIEQRTSEVNLSGKVQIQLHEKISAYRQALSIVHDRLGNIGQTAWDGNDELKRDLCSAARKEIRDALDELSKGEVKND
jgi:hypothetical protein